MTDDPRLAGGVKRWHIWPVVQQQTVAEHSWNVSRILLAIYPECPTALLLEALFHDCGEIATGDPPSTLKQRHPTLRDVYSKMEYEARLGMVIPWGLPIPHQLLPEERWVLKLADLIEMFEYASLERRRGNQFMMDIVTRLRAWIMIELEVTRYPALWRGRAEEYMARRMKEWEL
jgi:5'-deoxynucleotidase YfbR-like HD superfamily hydrolase